MRPTSARNEDRSIARAVDAVTSADLPYRRNVGAMVVNPDGLVFVGRRANLAGRGDFVWQMPQGGIDAGESPEAAVLRELGEEIGTSNAVIMHRHPDWLSYEFPEALMGRALGGRYRGQTQLWFVLRFLGTDEEIRLDADIHQEFDDWRWVRLDSLAELAVPFKRAVYARLAKDFAPYVAPFDRLDENLRAN